MQVIQSGFALFLDDDAMDRHTHQFLDIPKEKIEAVRLDEEESVVGVSRLNDGSVFCPNIDFGEFQWGAAPIANLRFAYDNSPVLFVARSRDTLQAMHIGLENFGNHYATVPLLVVFQDSGHCPSDCHA